MSEINSEVFIRRNKLRRQFETEFRELNASIKKAAIKSGVPAFFIKYSNHLLDRAIQREIDEKYVFALFKQLHNHVKEIHEFLIQEPLPDVESEIVPGKVYRPLRLEITDKTLWLGMTVDRKHPDKGYSLKCRMAFVNSKRLEGKTSTKVIYL
ncbi:endoribonuclease [Enterobacteria phage vB_EcoM_IME341]|uniref:Site-specific RNA endonuclease n=4 Tax=Caudoviricetes TaxID=2731619 RepID=A0A2S1GRX7_9CAUD|nr:endoribonuclease [Escherichia phage Bp7]YP_010094843.1 endoribonuclease [Enterobacteria phage vB_EcoM_IME341]YP_010100565.1 endoribonuclease [Escherichia phage vB_EcoM_005]QAY00139.1 site-specific RNA endonuclease [Escherichia phage EcWhh-1]QVW28256.1 site-specific RNA endonuclease [Escherichia phage C6]WPJ21428.1 endoribonuclease [Salmonella phage vB_SalD_ABTNLS3]AEN93741.1 site-specific RNA endonuclease [Escherichia phage Bp7]AWD92096.1 site-specific RNA endonuclease [Enterobacteria pha